MNQTKLIKLAQTLQLDQWFLNQLNKPNSIASRLYANLVYNFILQELDQESKTQFLELVSRGRGEAALNLAQAEIEDFETKLAAVTTEKLTQIKKKILQQ